ncbi:hypothetical protein GCM10007148_09790 [Parvularcula lutaonensis]|nr:hypothetical protein GCM10007148_09790 [Parvularcula lutaonensis]
MHPALNEARDDLLFGSVAKRVAQDIGEQQGHILHQSEHEIPPGGLFLVVAAIVGNPAAHASTGGDGIAARLSRDLKWDKAAGALQQAPKKRPSPGYRWRRSDSL